MEQQQELLTTPQVGARDSLPQLYRLETYRVQFVCEPGMNPGQPVRSSEDLASYARSIYATLDVDKEHFTVISTNNKNRVQGFKVVSTGSLTASLVHPREVWRSALHLCAAAVLFVHNHPSGDPAPSPEDIDITKRLKETADILGIRVLDHVILGHGRYFSFSDKGML
jgi:DNA repair protein RadC